MGTNTFYEVYMEKMIMLYDHSHTSCFMRYQLPSIHYPTHFKPQHPISSEHRVKAGSGHPRQVFGSF